MLIIRVKHKIRYTHRTYIESSHSSVDLKYLLALVVHWLLLFLFLLLLRIGLSLGLSESIFLHYNLVSFSNENDNEHQEALDEQGVLLSAEELQVFCLFPHFLPSRLGHLGWALISSEDRHACAQEVGAICPNNSSPVEEKSLLLGVGVEQLKILYVKRKTTAT